MLYKTLDDAVRGWVESFNAFPLGMIEKLFEYEPEDWSEITPIALYDRVYSDNYDEYGEVKEIYDNEDGEEIIKIELDSGEEVETDRDDLSRTDDSIFPMWSTLWQFSDSCDDWWLESHLQEVANCGFRIYESEEYGYFLGIDGAGYSFYEEHWKPLYKVRGLRWHMEEK